MEPLKDPELIVDYKKLLADYEQQLKTNAELSSVSLATGCQSLSHDNKYVRRIFRRMKQGSV